jgi:hypothetical protein
VCNDDVDDDALMTSALLHFLLTFRRWPTCACIRPKRDRCVPYQLSVGWMGACGFLPSCSRLPIDCTNSSSDIVGSSKVFSLCRLPALCILLGRASCARWQQQPDWCFLYLLKLVCKRKQTVI